MALAQINQQQPKEKKSMLEKFSNILNIATSLGGAASGISDLTKQGNGATSILENFKKTQDQYPVGVRTKWL